MAIEQPIIDAVTYDRRKAPDRDYQPILVSNIGPTQTGTTIDLNGDVVTVTRTPDYEGQCMLHARGGAENTASITYEMYCVVDFGGTLLWSKVDMTELENSFGEPWDPMGNG